jgi:NAD(P)-dependent dehydrogenase (short-subunit alcohol dehydrogenase family)
VTDRKALVVGGTSGIGKAIALGLADAGAHTIATSRRPELVQSVTEEIRSRGVKTLEQPCDALDESSLASLAARIREELGGLDILVYAAGATHKTPTADLSTDEWRNIMAVNVDGALNACKALYPMLKSAASARVLTIASLSSFVSFHQVAAYSASKAALLSLTKSLACEWAADGIRVNALVPGVFVTDLNRDLLNGTPRGQELLMRTPMKRFGEVDELVGAAIFLCSDAASFITGAALPVDGGFLASGVNQ